MNDSGPIDTSWEHKFAGVLYRNQHQWWAKLIIEADAFMSSAPVENYINAEYNTTLETANYVSYVVPPVLAVKGVIELLFGDVVSDTRAGKAAIGYGSAAVSSIGREAVEITNAVKAKTISIGKNVASFFGRSGRGGESLPNFAAHNAADALRLKTTLALQDAGILDQSGKLTDAAIKASELAMRPGSVLKNPSVVKVLTADGSDIVDWEKLTTQSVKMPSDQRIQVHFYRNKITGEVNYTHPDFKVKNPVNLFPAVPQQEATITPPYDRYNLGM